MDRALHSDRYFRGLIALLGLIQIVLGAVSFARWEGFLWGWHFYSFLPVAVAIAAWALWLAAAAWLLWPRGHRELPRRLNALLDRAAARLPLTLLICVVVSAALYWGFRSEQTLLGDSYTIMTDLPSSTELHPREPLTQILQRGLYEALGGFFRGQPSTEVVKRSIAVGSVACGMAFVAVALFLGRALAGGGVGILIAMLILSQGYTQLFFGYVENYAYYALGVALFLLAGIQFVRHRCPLIVPIIIFVFTVALHVSAIALAPALLYLIGFGFLRSSRTRCARDLVLGVAALMGLSIALGKLQPGASLLNSLRDVLFWAERDTGGGTGLSYMLSATHLRDFLSEHALTGPFALFLFLPTLALGLSRRAWRHAEFSFLAVAALAATAAEWLTSEPSLGYARDWDLFAPLTITMTVAGIAGMMLWIRNDATRRLLLASSLLLSLVHLAPWIYNNHSEQLALRRMEILPLGLGRAPFMVANWHWRHGDNATAMAWYAKAVQEHPLNHAAHFNLAAVLEEEGRHDEAVLSYERALAVRPRQREFRLALVRALIAARRQDAALEHLAELRRLNPDHYEFALYQGELFLALGRRVEAKQAYEAGVTVLNRPAFAVSSEFQSQLDAGMLMLRSGRDQAALPYLQNALAKDANSGRCAYLLSATLWRLERRQEARPYIERALELELPSEQRQQLSRWARALELGS